MDIVRDFLSVVPDRLVFHYTGEDAFRGIITDKVIRATNILQLDDETELRYSIGLAQERIKALGILQSNEDIEFLNLLDQILSTIHKSLSLHFSNRA